MSLRLIYGRAGSGKSRFCLDGIKEGLARGDRKIVLMVPEQFTLQTEKNIIELLGRPGIIDIEVLSFRRLAYRVFNEVGGITRKHINPTGKAMLIYRIIEKLKLKNNLKLYFNIKGQQGLIENISAIISELKTYRVSSDMLNKIQNNISGDNSLKDKLNDIGLIFEEFEKNIEGLYADSQDDLSLLGEKLDYSSQFDGSEIWIDEFSGFTPQEYYIIEKLLKKAWRVNISLCSDCIDGDCADSTELFHVTKKTAGKLLKLAKDNNITIEDGIELKYEKNHRFSDSEEIAHLEKYYGAYPYDEYKNSTKDICLFKAVNTYSEIEETAKDIIKLCRERQMRYKDIAIVSRDLSKYVKSIQVVFEQYGIPFFIDQKRDISSHSLIMLILSALEVISSNWAYEPVFRYLKTGLTGILDEEIDIIENYVLANGIKGSSWTKDGKWDYSISKSLGDKEDDKEEQLLEKINYIKNNIVKSFISLAEALKKKSTVKEKCTALYEFLCSINMPDRIQEYIDNFKAEGKLDKANEYSQIWNMLLDVLDQAVEVLGEENLSLEQFKEVLAIGFSECKMGLIPPALDQVLIGSIERSKSHEVKALYIIGVNDGVLPSSGKEEGLFTDQDREALKAKGIELAKNGKEQAFEEQFLIYRALTTSSKYIRISYPIADHEGKSMRPSMLIFRIKKLFPVIKEESNIVSDLFFGENLESVVRPVPTFNQMVSALRIQAEKGEISPLWKGVYKWYEKREGWSDKCEKALSGFNFDNQPSPVSSDKIRELYGKKIYSSVSRMEKFSSCPFSYYVEYGLKAKERKVFELKAPDLGTFLHTVIERFSQELKSSCKDWRDLDKRWCEEKIDYIIDNILNSKAYSILNSSGRYKYLSKRLKRVLSRAVWLISEHVKRGGFEPFKYEIAFGEEEGLPAIEIFLPEAGEAIKLTGRIDRIDILKRDNGIYLRIIDYKTGGKELKLSDIYYGLQLQLITYLNALLKNGIGDIKENIIPGGVLYFKIDDPLIKAQYGKASEDMEKEIMKELKMRGLLLADPDVIKEMDREIGISSHIIPAGLKADGQLTQKSSVATKQQFELLSRYVEKILGKLGQEILKGDISIRPNKNKNFTSCTYCSYHSICQFDPSLNNNSYRILNDKKDEEVWKLIREELECEVRTDEQ